MTIRLTGGTVLTALEDPELLQADVLVRDGEIAGIGDLIAGAATDDAGETIDCSGCLLVPGNVCAHTHAYSALATGMPLRLPAPTSFIEILQRIWWRLDRALDPPSIAVSALVAGRAALLAGTTTLIDHHASPNAIDGSLDLLAAAFERLGLRSVLAYEVTDRDGPERAAAGLEENDRFLRRIAAGARPLTRGLVGAHASFTLSRETLAACADLAAASGTGVHIHVAEDAIDEEDARCRFGERVVARLAGAGVLTPNAVLAHAVHLDPAEASVVRGTGAVVVHNPRSNMNNGVGRAPLGWLGERVALGTDGIGADMFEEGRVAFLRRREEEPVVGPDWAVARLAQGAALAGRIFGLPRLGTIEVGAPADLVVLGATPPGPMAAESLAAHWIFGLGAAAVRDVVVAGRVVVRERQLTTADDAELMTKARREATALWARMEAIGPHPFAPSERKLVALQEGPSWPT